MIDINLLFPGNICQSDATGQRYKVISVNGKEITYVALTAPSGRGSARAAKLNETRTVTNGHQWCQNVTRIG